MRKGNLELVVGLFVLLGLGCLAYLAIHLGKMEIMGSGYQVLVKFDNISGLKKGAAVEVAGVEVGRVESIQLSPGDRARCDPEIGARPQVARRCHCLHPHQGHHRRQVRQALSRQLGKTHSSGRQDPGHRVGHRPGRVDQQLHSRQSLSPD